MDVDDHAAQSDYCTAGGRGDCSGETQKNPSALAQVSFASYDEGRCAQILHKGPFAHEGPTVERVHAFIASSGLSKTKKHHEIYLGDFRRAAPQNWKTVIRQPMV